MKEVVGIVLVGPSGVLLEHRCADSTSYAGLWDTPGGKVEPGETPAQAIVREVFEELGMSIAPRPLGVLDDIEPTSKVHYRHHVYYYACNGEAPQAREGQQLKWVSIDRLAQIAPLNPIVIRSIELISAAGEHAR